MELPFTVLDDNPSYRRGQVVKLRKNLILRMGSFVEFKKIKQSVFEYDDELTLIQTDQHDRVELSYAGTRIRLNLIVGLHEGNAIGKVVCTHVFDSLGEEQSFYLGEFSIDERGRTNFGQSSGKPYFVNEAADLIIARYLAAALENNLKISPPVLIPEE